MIALADGTLVPGWLAIALAGATMLFVAAHVLAIQHLEMPASRRRIRTVTGVLMLILCAMLAYATGMVDPDEKRDFVLAWMAVIALLGIVLLLAGMDVLNTLRLHRRARADLRRMSRIERSGRADSDADAEISTAKSSNPDVRREA